MRLGLLVLVSLTAACTRPNPSFDDGDDPQGASTSSVSASLTSGPDDGVDGPVSSTGGSSNGHEADSATVGSTTVGSATMGSATVDTEGTTGPDAESTGGCNPVMLEPFADAFMASGSCEGGAPCESLNFGASPQGVIEAVAADPRSYLLMSFDLAEVTLPQAPLSATLVLHVGSLVEMELEASQVFPTAWSEGGGVGDMADMGEAAWNWSSSPTEWTTAMGASGTFDMVLGGAVLLGGANVAGQVGSHPADIPLTPVAIDDWIGGPDVIHLIVTKVGGEEPALAFSRESPVRPRLMITGC